MSISADPAREDLAFAKLNCELAKLDRMDEALEVLEEHDDEESAEYRARAIEEAEQVLRTMDALDELLAITGDVPSVAL